MRFALLWISKSYKFWMMNRASLTILFYSLLYIFVDTFKTCGACLTGIPASDMQWCRLAELFCIFTFFHLTWKNELKHLIYVKLFDLIAMWASLGWEKGHALSIYSEKFSSSTSFNFRHSCNSLGSPCNQEFINLTFNVCLPSFKKKQGSKNVTNSYAYSSSLFSCVNLPFCGKILYSAGKICVMGNLIILTIAQKDIRKAYKCCVTFYHPHACSIY